MKKWFLIAIGVVALGAAGYFGNEYRACAALEEDYLNAIDDMRGNIAIRSFSSNPDLMATLERRDELAEQQLEVSLSGLYDRCGERAADNATRKGQDMLLAL